MDDGSRTDKPMGVKHDQFKQVRLPPKPLIWPFLRECLYYSRAEAVNAGMLSGKPLPRGPPPDSYTLKDMVLFLRSSSSDHAEIDLGSLRPSDPDDRNDMQIRNILSEMDGSLGRIRLNRTDNTVQASRRILLES
jgi:hypothetical protein